MQIVFDRYEPRGGSRHVDLATGRMVDVVRRGVPDEGWRRRWRARVDALMTGCAGLELLLDAGDAGRHDVFEVREVPTVAPARPRRVRDQPARLAIAWLASRSLSAGPCRASRLLWDGRLCADAQAGWPIETAGETRSARASWRAWRRLVGGAPAPADAAGGSGDGYGTADDALDERAGLIELAMDAARALRFARESGRIAVAGALDPREVPRDLRRRSFVIVGGAPDARAAWSASLAVAGPRRHVHVAAHRRAFVARERAPAYVVEGSAGAPAARLPRASARAQALLARAAEALARKRLAPAGRHAGRAALAGDGTRVRAESLAIQARVLRLQGRPRDAVALLARVIDDRPVPCALLVEAAEAATDCARLEQGEAFARAALFAAAGAGEEAASHAALDRARVWRGEAACTPLWKARAAWHAWGRPPLWPSPGGYPHAPCGPLARWEGMCDALERALWRGDERHAARVTQRLARINSRLPPLLRARAEWLGRGSPDLARRLGATAVLQTGKAGAMMEVFEHMSLLLAMCHDQHGDAALAGAAARTRQVLRARSVAIHAAGRALPVAGDGDGWNGACELAARCAAAAHTAGPERTASGARAAAPIGHGGVPAGAILAVWPAGAEIDDRRVRLLLESAALVLAPVLRAWCDQVEPPPSRDMPEIVGTSPAIGAVRDGVRRVARVAFPVLIEGESGAGKELVARAVHRLSPRAARPFRALNCAAMAEDLVEAELFGHAQGAFTGAASARAGLFEDADHGTLLLDEVSELSPRAQAKLLRVLQEGEVRRVGETAPRRVDVRIIAASNRPLRSLVDGHAFRADLSFRLDVLRIVIPPLRERPEDIGLLCAHFWREAAARAGTSAALSADAVGWLAAYAWPGNVRELQNVIAALAVSAPRRGKVVCADLPPHIRTAPGAGMTLHQARATLERDLVSLALARAGGRPGRAAAELGVSRQGLAKLMRRLGLPAA